MRKRPMSFAVHIWYASLEELVAKVGYMLHLVQPCPGSKYAPVVADFHQEWSRSLSLPYG